MPAARPSKAAVTNVIDALKASGQVVRAVRVHADGSFEVETGTVPESQAPRQSEPKRWGQTG